MSDLKTSRLLAFKTHDPWTYAAPQGVFHTSAEWSVITSLWVATTCQQ